MFRVVLGVAIVLAFTAFNRVALAEDAGENNNVAQDEVGPWNAKRGSLPGFVFAGTEIKDNEAAFFCLPSSNAVWALIDAKLYALNDEAEIGSVIMARDQLPTTILPWTDSSNPAGKDENIPTRILAQAERVCDPQPIRDTVRSGGNSDPYAAFYLLCKIVDGTGISASPCEVSAWSRTVTVTADVRGKQARAICKDMQGAARSLHLRSGWKAEIVSPFSNGKSLAFCDL